MLKKLKELLRRDPEQFRIPRSVQEVIPIRTVWKSGIFLVGANRYSRTWQFSDINYALAGEEDQKSMLLGYSGLLNLCDSNASTKFSVVTRKLNRRDFEDYIMIPYANDGHDHYRREYNAMLLEKASHASGMIRDLYITVTVTRKSYKDAESYFVRAGAEFTLALSRLGSRCTELDMMDRLRVLHGFYRHGEEADFHFDPALSIGVQKLDILRTFTSESLAALMPFRVQEIMEPGGIYYGENAISGNLLLCNRANLLNQSTIITGVPSSGKSFSAKELITFLALATQDDILVCDLEREYYALGQALGGEVIRIAAGSPDHINAMDMVEGYGDGGNPVVDKSEFILSLFEQLDRGGIGPLQKSIIDRCVDAVYAAYKRGGPVPTLCVLREKLLEQPEEEARDLALALELFTTGSLDAFAHETNVDTQNRIVIYDIMDLGRQLKTMGLLIITDAMLNRVTENWRKGKRTHLFIDEFHVVFQNPYSADFFDSAWRRFRKRGAYPTAITQNVEYLLDSVQASTMLSNSEMLILLNQAPSDREKLAALLNISPEQTSYITNAPAGCGLLRYGGALVPFKNQFPKDTELYRLMTTKPDESIIVGGKTK